MKYSKADAKAYARAHFRGVWAATATPFDARFRLDEAGFKHNLTHWIETLKLGGLFVCGKQGEFFSMTVAERKRTFELAVEAAAAAVAAPAVAGGRAGIVTSCSDTNLDVVLELARHSQAIGADYIVVHSPLLHFGHAVDDTVYEYYRYLSEQLDIGIALWNHPDSGYLMSPELCMRIAQLPNIVAIKYSVPREMYARLSRMAGDQIIVSTASEEEWFDNIVELGWRLYLCSTPGARRLQSLAPHRHTAGAYQILDGTNRPRWRASRRHRAPAPAQSDRRRKGRDSRCGGPIRAADSMMPGARLTRWHVFAAASTAAPFLP